MMTVNNKQKTVKKVLLPAMALLTASSVASLGYAESGNAMLKNDPNPINSAVQKTKKVISDTLITGAIKADYAKSDLLSALGIKVKTVKGDVALSGKVNTDMQYEQAVMLAESTEGVKDVNAEQLHVKDSQQPLTDTFITAKVKGQLLKQKIMGENVQVWPISVETKDGVVYLTGEVDSEAQKTNVLNAVKSVKGIKSVESDIKVKKDTSS